MQLWVIARVMITDPALILLDVTKKTTQREATDGSFEVDKKRQSKIDAMIGFLDRYRSTGRTPIFVRGLHHPHTMSENWSEKYDRPLEEVYNVGSEGAELNPDLDPGDHEPVINKHRYSGFYQTDLDLHLSANDVDRVVIAGFGTPGAVAHTVFDAFNRDYRITVLSDCVGSRNRGFHRTTLGMLKRGYADVKPSTELQLGPIEEPSFGYDSTPRSGRDGSQSGRE